MRNPVAVTCVFLCTALSGSSLQAACLPCTAAYTLQVDYSAGGTDQQALLNGTTQVNDGVLDLNVGPVQSLLVSAAGSSAVLKDVVYIKLNGVQTAPGGNDVLLTKSGGLVAWVDAPNSGMAQLHLGTVLTQSQPHPFTYAFTAGGTDSPPVDFQYTLTASGNEKYHAPAQKVQTVAIPKFSAGANCRAAESTLCLEPPTVGTACKLTSFDAHDTKSLHVIERRFEQQGDHCVYYKVTATSTDHITLKGGGHGCDGSFHCDRCGGEYEATVTLNGYCDLTRGWTNSISGTGHAEANPSSDFSAGYAAGGGVFGSPGGIGLAGPTGYSWLLSNCSVAGTPLPCTDTVVTATILGDTLKVKATYARPVSTTKNGNATIAATQGIKQVDTLPYTTENNDVRHSVAVTFQGTLYRDLNGDGIVDAGPFSVWTGGAGDEELWAAFDRSSVPVATIDSITPNPALAGQSISFAGHGTGPFNGYVWTTHRLDQPGGTQIGAAASFSRNDLVPGTHQISLRVSGTPYSSPSTIRTLAVNQPPVAWIKTIVNANDAAHPSISLLLHSGAPSDPFIFDGGGVDADGSVVAYEWRSDIEPGAVLGTTAHFEKSLAALGTHTISLRVRDNSGTWSAPATQKVTVRRPPVLLVHGLCGASDSWDELVSNNWLTGYDVSRRTFDPNNDGNTNDSPAAVAQLVLDEIQTMKQTFGVRAVDIVSHSMGGLSSRAYIQGPAFQNDVNKLVMLGTPNHGSTIADLALMSNGFTQADLELFIPNDWARAALLALGLVVDVVEWLDPENGLVCLGEESPALWALRPHSSFLRSLNANSKDDGTEDFGASGQPPDARSSLTQYFTIHGTRLTVSHTHLPSSLVNGIRIATQGAVDLEGLSLLWARDGDTVVTSPSVRLDGVPADGFHLKHRQLEKRQISISKAADYLDDDPPPAETAGTGGDVATTAQPVGAGRGSWRADRADAPGTFLVDAAALRIRVSADWSRAIAAPPSPPTPSPSTPSPSTRTVLRAETVAPVVVLTSPSGVRYASDVSRPGLTVKTDDSDLEVVIEAPEAGAWQVAVLAPGGGAAGKQAVVRDVVPYSWMALEETGTFLAVGVSKELVAPGETVTIAAYLQKDGTGARGAEMHGAVSNGGEKSPLTFTEEPAVAGLYTAKYVPATSGIYRVIASAGLPTKPEISRVAIVNFQSSLVPDLTISLAAVPDAPRHRDTVRLTATVTNHGKAAAAAIPVRFFDGLPARGGKLLGQTVVNVPAMGTTSTTLPWLAQAGSHTLGAVVDPMGISGEINVSDNLATRSIVVRDVNPPVARAGPDQVARVGQSIVLDGLASSDDDRIATYRWTNVSASPASQTTTLRTISRPALDGGYAVLVGGFPAVGTYVMRLTVADASGNAGSDDLVVRVVGEVDTEPPVANAGPGITTVVGASVQFNGTASHDNYGIGIATWDVDVTHDSDGDGDPADDQDLVGLSPTLSGGYSKPGSYRARLTVRDAAGNGASTADVVVTVLPPAQVSSSSAHESEVR